MLTLSPPIISADAVDAAKTYLRIESDEEDASIAALMAAAIRLAEGFLNRILLRRTGVDRMSASSAWQRLGVSPVQAITGVTGIPAEGATFALASDAYALDIDGAGDGWVRIIAPGSASPLPAMSNAVP